ncbi:hypothetical protein [Microbacterium rhizomatis]|uniref:Uncharacterized protein n=1 Tax=Microbacterium rhizomatis TaxID=1631477 RepID=A0A5J5J490_9MICO|nr:hypothetical protein [Microbacterium rhizomatis]KAA9108153.1 hypothetical protein F6B43_12160 [Microbacterium rhizomatis]
MDEYFLVPAVEHTNSDSGNRPSRDAWHNGHPRQSAGIDLKSANGHFGALEELNLIFGHNDYEVAAETWTRGAEPANGILEVVDPDGGKNHIRRMIAAQRVQAKPLRAHPDRDPYPERSSESKDEESKDQYQVWTSEARAPNAINRQRNLQH